MFTSCPKTHKNYKMFHGVVKRLSEKPNFRIFQLYCLNLTGRSIVI